MDDEESGAIEYKEATYEGRMDSMIPERRKEKKAKSIHSVSAANS